MTGWRRSEQVGAEQIHGMSEEESETGSDILEDLDSKVCSDDEKENVNVCVEENNMISNCDINNGDTEKKADNAVYKGEESSDRINLAEIKI